MQSIAIVDERYESLPVFPLPTFVLFPQTTTRLHVFEPRYRMLVSDALATNRLLVLVGLKPGWEDNYYGSPPAHEFGSLCRIVNEERLEDGRYNLYVHCLARVRLRTIHQLQPYRTAEVEVIDDSLDEPVALEAAIERLTSTVRGLMLQRGDHAALLAAALSSSKKPGILTHRLAAVLAFEPTIRQQLLETPSPLQRAERLCDIAGDLLLRTTELSLVAEGGDGELLN